MIKIEETLELEEDLVGFTQPVSVGLNMIFRGEDTKPGDRIIHTGKRLKIADTGTLAAMGIMDVPVMKKPRVGIISTGDEVVPADEEISGGMIRDANAPMLANAIRVSGGQAVFFGIVKDQIKPVQQLIQKAVKECDLVIISGGTSMDTRDTVASIINQLGQVLVHGITLKPGKPTIIGTIQDKPVFGLPGNPVSVYFTFHLLVRPLLHALQGTHPTDRHIQLPLARDISPNDGRQEYIPVLINDNQVHPVAFKSGLITTVSCADGYICLPRGSAGIPKGTLVEVTFLDR
jgi:molybdopterin molybdotransferase